MSSSFVKFGGCAGCADTIDVGEASYSMVLADDMDANGHMELIVTTMHGNVYCFETQAPYDPLLAWPSQVCLISQSNHCFLGNSPGGSIRINPFLPKPAQCNGSHQDEEDAHV